MQSPTPKHHDRAQPCRRGNLPNEDIARYFEEDIGNEKHEQSNIVVLTFHVKVFLQTLKSCIADVDSVEEC